MTIVLFVPEFRKFGSSALLVNSIQNLAADLGADFEVVYIKKDVNPLQQQQFLYAVHIADVVIVDCTIPQDNTDGGVYPALTAQINSLNHIIVVSENNLPLNIVPYRGVYPKKDGERYDINRIIELLPDQIGKSLSCDKYARLPIDMYKDIATYQDDMIKMLSESHEVRKKEVSRKTPVMISYRNSHGAEVENFKKLVEAEDEASIQMREEMGIPGNFELKILPPASLCGADEAHTPMRRWMLVGLLEDHIREVDEVWVYESRDKEGNIDYTDSWWTIAELVMVANVNYSSREKPIKVRVYNPVEKKFHDITEPDYSRYTVAVSQEQYERLARILANTRPDTMGPECLAQIKQMKLMAKMMRFCTGNMKRQMLDELRRNIEQMVPESLIPEERENMIESVINLYSNPKEMERYANDDVFKDKFWNEISYQTKDKTDCFTSDGIDVDKFISIPMEELTGYSLGDLAGIVEAKRQKINFGTRWSPLFYQVTKANTERFLWLATRMGNPTIKAGNAPGLERIPIYNIRHI